MCSPCKALYRALTPGLGAAFSTAAKASYLHCCCWSRWYRQLHGSACTFTDQHCAQRLARCLMTERASLDADNQEVLARCMAQRTPRPDRKHLGTSTAVTLSTLRAGQSHTLPTVACQITLTAAGWQDMPPPKTQIATCLRNLDNVECGGQLPLDQSVWTALPDLTTLRLNNNSCDGYVPAIMFSNSTNITTVDMRNNQFTGDVPYRNSSTGQQSIAPSQAPLAGASSARSLQILP